MSDFGDFIVAAVRKHITDRRVEIAAKFPMNLSVEEYSRQCGRHSELESLAAVFQDAVRKANAQDHEPEEDPDV